MGIVEIASANDRLLTMGQNTKVTHVNMNLGNVVSAQNRTGMKVEEYVWSKCSDVLTKRWLDSLWFTHSQPNNVVSHFSGKSWYIFADNHGESAKWRRIQVIRMPQFIMVVQDTPLQSAQFILLFRQQRDLCGFTNFTVITSNQATPRWPIQQQSQQQLLQQP